MKRNIDLTENFDFAIPRRASTQNTPLAFRSLNLAVCSRSKSIIGNMIKKDIVDFSYCIEEDIEHEHGGMIQGNGYRRRFMKSYNEPETHCERCGCSKKYPWEDFSTLLCHKCNKSMDYEFHKIPWR